MLALISPLITRGVIDNSVRDLIDLRLYCSDGREPLHLRMRGNCLRDIAGCRVEFSNRAAGPSLTEEPLVLRKLRQNRETLYAGDISLSRRQPDQDNRQSLCNLLSLEFFVSCRVRVLIESSAFDFSISLPQWEMSWEEANAQEFFNMDALRNHVAYCVEHFQGAARAQEELDFPHCDWDTRLNRAEAYMAIYPSIHEKYRYIPGAYLSAAYVLNRMDFLDHEAKLDESHMPPDPETYTKDWEVIDFVDADLAPAVTRAMRHPLFLETSRMTALVQNALMDGGKELPQSSNDTVDRFVSCYAGIVSHILGTILLTQEGESGQDSPNRAEEQQRSEQAERRLDFLSLRMRKLLPLCEALPPQVGATLIQATETLLQKLEDFALTLKP